MKKGSNNKNIIIMIIGAVLIIVGILLAVFNKKVDTNVDNNEDNTILEENAYKTSDGRFILKIVEKDDKDAYDSAKVRYGEDSFDNYISPYVIAYGYINNKVFAIDEKKEDENYAVFSFVGLPTEESGHKVLVNKRNSLIEVSEEDLQKVDNTCLNNGFCGFQSQPNYIQTTTGYFFITNDLGLITIYTTNWKKVGYIDKMINLKTDEDGSIYVYEKVESTKCYGKDCDYKPVGNLIKYDVDGNKK